MFDETLIECPNGHSRLFRQYHNGRTRRLQQFGEDRIKKGQWLDCQDDLPNGIYCERCNDGAPLPMDLEEIAFFGLNDLPLEVPNHETAAQCIVRQVHKTIGSSPFAVHTEPAREAVYGPEPEGLHPQVRGCFPTQFYIHQSKAITSALDGKDVVQTTGTGSGKSVGFWAPVLAALATDPTATAIAIFPRIALGNDQVQHLASLSIDQVTDTSLFSLALGTETAPIDVGIMNWQRKESFPQILKKARLIITTPDQLHSRILPYMKKSDRFIAGLRYVVLDEIHTYTGQEGSIMSSLLQRLQVSCLHASGNTPQFLMSSASLSNVSEFTRRLIGRPDVEVVSEDGSPKQEFTTFVIQADHRTFIPALHTEMARGFDGAPPTGLTFVQSKEGVKALAEISQEALQGAGFSNAANSVIAYSSQDDAESRADKESRIAKDSARFVLTTSALELGVNFTNVHYSVTTEYSGLVMETRQRIGRAGRQHAGVGIILIESRKQPSWPTSPTEALETIRFAPAEIQAPVMTSKDRENVLIIGLAHDLHEVDLELVRKVDPQLVDDLRSSEYWEESNDSTLSAMCFEKLGMFRGSSEKGVVFFSRGNRILTNWSGADLARYAWCGNRLSMDDGRQYEVVSVKRSPYGNGNWEIKVSLADEPLEVESAVYTRVIDEVVSSTEKLGRFIFTRSEARLKHALSTSRRRQPGGEWVSHNSSRRINQVTSEQTAVTSIRFTNKSDQEHIETVRILIMACLDAIGVSQYDIWSTSESGRILFYDPQGRTSPVAWTIVDRLDELARVAEERIGRFGCLLVNGEVIPSATLLTALDLLTNHQMEKAA